ncbi:MAG: hypothetical protein V1835_03370 [Candidatus Micrarchaeota archaeon]
MEPENIGDIVLWPMVCLLIIDFLDFLVSHYTFLKVGIPELAIDAFFFVIAVPFYAWVAKKVIYEYKGDAEDAGIATFVMSFSKWLVGWSTTIFFFFVLTSSGQGLFPQPINFIDPIQRLLSLRTVWLFAWHVIGAGIGGNLFGYYYEKKKEDDES